MVKSKSSIPKITFQPGETVFAKIKGYPWWPARIATENDLSQIKAPPNSKYAIIFFGTHESGNILPKDLVPFNDESVAKFGAPNNKKGFLEAMWEIVNTPDVDIMDFVGKGALLQDMVAWKLDRSLLKSSTVPEVAPHVTAAVDAIAEHSRTKTVKNTTSHKKKKPVKDESELEEEAVDESPGGGEMSNLAIDDNNDEETGDTTSVVDHPVPDSPQHRESTTVVATSVSEASTKSSGLPPKKRAESRFRDASPNIESTSSDVSEKPASKSKRKRTSQPRISKSEASASSAAESETPAKSRRLLQRHPVAQVEAQEEPPAVVDDSQQNDAELQATASNNEKPSRRSSRRSKELRAQKTEVVEGVIEESEANLVLQTKSELFATTDSGDDTTSTKSRQPSRSKKRQLQSSVKMESVGSVLEPKVPVLENARKVEHGTDSPPPPDPSQSTSGGFDRSFDYSQSKSDIPSSSIRTDTKVVLEFHSLKDFEACRQLDTFTRDIKKYLQKNQIDIPRCLLTLRDILQTPMSREAVLKTPSFVETIKRCRKFTGNDEIRNKATEICEIFFYWFPPENDKKDTSCWDRYKRESDFVILTGGSVAPFVAMQPVSDGDPGDVVNQPLTDNVITEQYMSRIVPSSDGSVTPLQVIKAKRQVQDEEHMKYEINTMNSAAPATVGAQPSTLASDQPAEDPAKLLIELGLDDADDPKSAQASPILRKPELSTEGDETDKKDIDSERNALTESETSANGSPKQPPTSFDSPTVWREADDSLPEIGTSQQIGPRSVTMRQDIVDTEDFD